MKKVKKCVNVFPSFCLVKENQKTKLEKRNKKDDEKWKLIQEEQEIRTTNCVKIFVEAGKRKNDKKGFKNPSYKNKRNIILKKKLPKKEIGEKKKTVDSEKTQKK